MATEVLTVQNIKKVAKKLNNNVIKNTDKFVDVAIEQGGEWQKVLAKALKNGTTLFGQQQELTLTTLEEIKAQSIVSGKRFGKLIGFKSFSKKVKDTAKATKKAAKAKAEKVTDDVVNKVTKASKATKATKKAVAKKATTKKVSAKKAVVKTTKVAKKVAVTKTDLKAIEGIGPKMETILNKAGINTYAQLATTKIITLKEILAAAGPRYKMINTSTWAKQARLARDGKWDALITLQGTIKGGKIVKK